MVNQGINNTKVAFKLNGKELMETTHCIWVEPTLNASIIINNYSDGSFDKSVKMSMAGLQEYNTLPFNDFPDIYYVYFDHVGMLRQGSLVGNDTVCQHQFYNYQ